MIAGLALVRRPAALLLDAGDTLIFFDAAAMAEVLAAGGERVVPAELEHALHAAKQRYQAFLKRGGKHDDGWYVVVHEAVVGAGVARDRAEALLPALRRAHDAFNFWRRVPEGTADALDRAHAAGIRLGIVSNSEGRLAEVLDRVGLLPRFEVVLDSQLEGVHKPDPEIFRRALARLGVSAARALYAGDVPEVDVGGAAAAGMPAVLIDPHGRYAGEAYVRARSVVELVDALLELPA